MDWDFIQIGIVVDDIDRYKENWRRLLKTEPFIDGHCPPFRDVPTYMDGKPCDCSDVRFVKFKLDEKHVIALFQPGERDNPWKRWKDKHGASFMFAEFKAADVKQTYSELGQSLGKPAPYHYGTYPEAVYSLTDTEDLLGFQLNICGGIDSWENPADAAANNADAEKI